MRAIVAVAFILLTTHVVYAGPKPITNSQLCKRGCTIAVRDAKGKQLGPTVEVFGHNSDPIRFIGVLVDFPAPEGGTAYSVLFVSPRQINGGFFLKFESLDCTGDPLIKFGDVDNAPEPDDGFPNTRGAVVLSGTGEAWMALDEELRLVDTKSSKHSDGTCGAFSDQSWVKTGALVEANIYQRFPPPYSIAVVP